MPDFSLGAPFIIGGLVIAVVGILALGVLLGRMIFQ